MSSRSLLASAVLAFAAVLPSGASAATSGTVSLRTDGQPVVARILGTQDLGLETRRIACLDREPVVTLTGARGGTANIQVNLFALWLPTTLFGGIFHTGDAVATAGATTPIDLIAAFNQAGGGYVGAQFPIGRGPGKGTTSLYAQTYRTVAGSIQLPALSNVIAIRTSITNDVGGACPSGRTLYL